MSPCLALDSIGRSGSSEHCTVDGESPVGDEAVDERRSGGELLRG